MCSHRRPSDDHDTVLHSPRGPTAQCLCRLGALWRNELQEDLNQLIETVDDPRHALEDLILKMRTTGDPSAQPTTVWLDHQAEPFSKEMT